MRFTGAATNSYHQNHLALWVGDMTYGTWLVLARRQLCTNLKCWPKLAYALIQQPMQVDVSLFSSIHGSGNLRLDHLKNFCSPFPRPWALLV